MDLNVSSQVVQVEIGKGTKPQVIDCESLEDAWAVFNIAAGKDKEAAKDNPSLALIQKTAATKYSVKSQTGPVRVVRVTREVLRTSE